jgi:hypothetical protein
VPNGVLVLRLKNVDRVNVRKERKDGVRKTLEHQLNDIVAHLNLAAEGLKEKRLQDEAVARARVEREKREYQEYLRRQEEKRKAEELSQMLEGWRLGRDIRAFVAEAVSLGADPADRLDWALGYADEIDPLGNLRGNAGHRGEVDPEAG